jgi:hypothetical protein
VYRPRRELQKAAPRNFDAFFEPVYFEKQKKTVEIPLVPALIIFVVFVEARLCAIHGFSRAIAPVHVAIKRQKQKGDFTMTTSNTKRIAELNDLCRKAPGIAGRMFITQGITALPAADQSEICEKVETFDTFAQDNDPHGEHDFGAFEHNGQKIFWKIDYYDRASFGTGRDMGSEDPSDPAKTLRVLTIMLASEY